MSIPQVASILTVISCLIFCGCFSDETKCVSTKNEKLAICDSKPIPKLNISKRNDSNYRIWFMKDGKREGYGQVAVPEKGSASIGKSKDFKDSQADVLNICLDKVLSVTKKNNGTVKFFLCPKPQGGKYYRSTVWIKANKASSAAKIMFAGRAGGEFYVSQRMVETKTVEVDMQWRQYEITAKIPSDITGLYLRVDVFAGADYELARPRMESYTKIDELKGLPQGNLIVNGGAERGWYQTGASDLSLTESPSGDFVVHFLKNPYYDWATKDGYADWSLDDKVKHSGRASFKCHTKNKVPKSHDLKFNLVPVLRGKSAHFSVWLKADKPTSANLRLIASPGTGYSRKIQLGTTWKKYAIDVKNWGKRTKNADRSGPEVFSHGNVVSGYGILRANHAQPIISFSGQNSGFNYWIDDACYWLEGAPSDNKVPGVLLRGMISNSDTKCFRNGETVKVPLEIENTSDSASKIKLSYSIIDYFGKVVLKSKAETLSLKSKAVLKREFNIEPVINGPQTLSFKVEDINNKKEYSHNCFFGVIGKTSKMYKKLGMNHWTYHSPEHVFPYLKKFGVGSIRIWSKMLRPNGINVGSDAVAMCKKAGFYVLYCNNRAGADPKLLAVAKDLTKWKEDLKRNVIYHKGMVDCYEILNEPNIWRLKKTYPDIVQMTPKEYVRVLQTAAPIIRKYSPNSKIGGPTVAHTATNWISSVLKLGGYKDLDIITEHPYRRLPEAPDYAKDLKVIQKLSEQYYHRQVPIYATEAGLVTPAMPIDNLITKDISDSVGFDLRRQIIGFANGVDIFFHFNVLNVVYGGTSWTTFFSGNPGNNLKLIPHPHLYATYYLGHFIGDAEAAGEVTIDYSMRCFIFKKEKESVAVLWKWHKTDSPAVLNDCKAGCKVFDLFANSQKFPVTISNNPVFITSKMSVEELKNTIKNMNFSGLGFPIKAEMMISGQKTFEIKLKNCSKSALNGKCELSKKKDLIPLDDLNFNGFASGGEKTIRFKTEKPISLNPFDFNFKVIADGQSDFLSKRFNLRGQFCTHIDNEFKIDGKLDDWKDLKIKPFIIDGKNNSVITKDGYDPSNISAEIYTSWNNGFLNVAVCVKGKKEFVPPENASWMWKCDSVQIGFDTIKNAKPDVSSGYQDDDYEYHFGVLEGKPTVYRANAAALLYDGVARNSRVVIKDVPCAITHKPGQTIYEIAFPAPALSPFRLSAGNSIRWSVLINLNDGKERVGWLELTPGIGQYPKNPSQFVDLILVD